jgi:hypothetical protein
VNAIQKYWTADNKTYAVLREHGFDPMAIPSGAHVPDGWLGILDRLLGYLRRVGWSGRIHQIKAKFGRLAFYAEDMDAVVAGAIQKAEDDSLHTCEDCGDPRALPRVLKGWLSTYCNGCAR